MITEQYMPHHCIVCTDDHISMRSLFFLIIQISKRSFINDNQIHAHMNTN